ncbi:MAG: hypothetical protein HC905_24150 [Bacteroidales bacterium]|nr:hypothetical protein [Bacteroidales bacterium]
MIRELKVAKASQNITFETISSKMYGDTDIELSAEATSGLVVTLQSNYPDIAGILNGKLHIVSAGVVTITATQPGNNNFLPAEKSQEVVISKAPLTVTAMISRAKKANQIQYLPYPIRVL